MNASAAAPAAVSLPARDGRMLHGLGPADAGVRSLGHRGFFAERHRDLLWPGALDWLDAHCR